MVTAGAYRLNSEYIFKTGCESMGMSDKKCSQKYFVLARNCLFFNFLSTNSRSRNFFSVLHNLLKTINAILRTDEKYSKKYMPRDLVHYSIGRF